MIKSLIRHSLEGVGFTTLFSTLMVLAFGLPLGIVDTYGVFGFFTGIACGIVVGTGLLNLSEQI